MWVIWFFFSRKQQRQALLTDASGHDMREGDSGWLVAIARGVTPTPPFLKVTHILGFVAAEAGGGVPS